MHSQPVAIVTGASSGIGLETARALAERGWGVMLAARRSDGLEEAAKRIRSAAAKPDAIVTQVADMGDVEQIRVLVERTIERFGRLDGLVNNAGWAEQLSIERSHPELIKRAHEVNAIGPACAIHFAWLHLVSNGGGRIVNISTMGTKDPFPGFFAYAASKAPLNVMTASCDNEGVEHGVRAFAVAPGAVETPMLRSMFDESMLPGDMCLAPGQVAEVIVACLSGARDVDGGRTIFVQASGGALSEEVA